VIKERSPSPGERSKPGLIAPMTNRLFRSLSKRVILATES
jgi:hypothetical protein